jgi:hypothetical protein
MNQNSNAAALQGVPPISYPTFVLNGKSYIAKFGLGAMYRLETLGINPANLKDEITSMQAAGQNINLILKLAAASLGTETEDGRFHALGLMPEELADSIGESPEAFKALSLVVTQALLKVRPPATAQTPAAIPDQEQVQ